MKNPVGGLALEPVTDPSQAIASALEWLEKAEGAFSRPDSGPLKASDRRDLVSFYLFLAVQHCLDLAVHAAAELGTPPHGLESTFDTLAGQGFLDRDLALRMRGALVFRNRIAHDYGDFDEERLWGEFPVLIATVRRFLLKVSEAAGL